ncbi:MAG TPA: type II toxin-antitoxin system VapC family toxin [Candidatus Acidoferrum sp.]|nr:type II toxin-antitoxin system VapC family toxin [Candidatus Acidoferrum sp.]
MSRFVLDCSVTMAWCFENESDAYARSVLASIPRGPAVVPPLWFLEVANVLLVAERRRRITRIDASRFLELLAELPVVVAEPEGILGVATLVTLGRDLGLSAYDACYLHLARRERMPLATRDRALREAARRAGVALYDPTR